MTLAPGANNVRTLIELLTWRAQSDGDATAYTYDDEARTFGRLWADVETFAMTLIESGLQPGDRVVLALPNGHEFFTTFYGIQAAGGIAVPIFPGVSPSRVIDVAHLCSARHMVVAARTTPDVLERWRVDAGELSLLSTLDTPSRTFDLPSVAPEDVAFIQYTSGSTGDPKGVQLSHHNLLVNVHQIVAGMEITDADRFVSWLPTFHDLGLIIMTIVPFFVGAPLFLLPTDLRNPGRWLEAIERHRGTFTASPDFGYRLGIRHAVTSGAHFDLSSLRVALNAAEPVRRSTIEGFHDTFGLNAIMVAGYGLAEASVGVSMWRPSTPNLTDARGTVSVGHPFPGVEVKIVDDDEQAVPAGESGHIIVRSAAATRGYYENPAATAELLVAPDTIRTGDIGYLDADGHLYILSRAKDVIIQAGMTVYPQEVEELANAIEGVRYSAAIGVDDGRVEGEQVVVFVEIRPEVIDNDEARKSTVVSVVAAVHERFGFRPMRVHLVAPKTIPLTPNGKLQRSELKVRYLDGSLKAGLLYPITANR